MATACVSTVSRCVRLIDKRMYCCTNPPGYLVSARDPHHVRTIYQLLRGIDVRIFPVGRLDLDTRGVLLLMDDGDLAFRLTPSALPRGEEVYRAWMRGHPNAVALTALREGVKLGDGTSAPARVRVVRARDGNTELEFVLHEGRKRQVKQMCAAVGHRGAMPDAHALCRPDDSTPPTRPMAAP